MAGKLVTFLESHNLDTETVSYLRATFEDGGFDDFVEVAEAFLSEDAMNQLLNVDLAAATEAAPAAVPKDLSAGVSLAAMAVPPVQEKEASPAPFDKPSTGEKAKSKVSKFERRQAKSNAKLKGKASAKAAAGAAEVDARDLQDVAAFGLAETEEGLDAFDSFAICWGSVWKHKLQNRENSKDINLPLVYIGIVTDQGQKDLINGASLKVMRGHKYGLIGRNGCGKTTLMRRIARRQLPGLPLLRYGYVTQELVGTEQSVLDAACTGDAEYQALLKERTRLETALEKTPDGTAEGAAETAELTESFSYVMRRLDEVEESFGKDGLTGFAREILLGLQFTPEQLEFPTRALSGGWKMRLALAQALLSRADCLLLDEPTNHLDLAGVLWLQDFLQNKLDPDCMLVMISHDRVFLDTVVTDIIEIKHQSIEQGPGSYSQWAELRQQERDAITAKLEANERERERTKEMVQHMRQSAASHKKGKEADANKLRQAKQREVQLYGKVSSSGESKTYGRLELADFNGKTVDIKALAAVKLGAEEKMKFKLPEPELLSGALLQLDGASYTIKEIKRTILKNVKLLLQPTSRVAVVGSNGAGKTTLLKWLEGDDQWPGNKAKRHPKLKVAHVSQHHLERLEDHLGETCLEWIRGALPPLQAGQDPNTTLSNVAKDEFLYGYLSGFGLSGKIPKQKLGTLSGGQKARLAFAAEVWFKPHLLLLDEPTNHLDIETLDSLAEALKAYPGAVVIVSHNQTFLKEVCNELWIVDAGRVTCTGRGEGGFTPEFEAYKRKVIREIKKYSITAKS